MNKIVHVVGARPNFMKVAPIIKALSQHARSNNSDLTQVLVHTGQHYTPEMSSLFFDELGLPEPDINLEIGAGSHGRQTGRIMEAFEQVLLEVQPDAVLVVGDVNSTMACAIDAKKLGIKVIHVEAGLRSGDMTMPEEINRILTDSISDLLFTTEASGNSNLAQEGIAESRIHMVGNVMIDSLLEHKSAADQQRPLIAFSLQPQSYGLVTLHRPSNVDQEQRLRQIVGELIDCAQETSLLMPLHPRTRQNLKNFKLISQLEDNPLIHLCPPLGYLDFLHCMANARFMVTDSGGVQEETTILKVPCITVRENTERPITISHGTNKLVGTAPGIIKSSVEAVLRAPKQELKLAPPLWDGKAGQRIAEILLG